MREDRYSLDSTCLCTTLLLGTGGHKLDMVSLVKEFFMHTKWKIGRSIYSDLGIVTRYEHSRMIGAIERNVVCGIPGIRYMNTLDQTHATWENGIMTFHTHDHGDRQNIPKDSHKISAQCKEFVLFDIECRNSSQEFK